MKHRHHTWTGHFVKDLRVRKGLSQIELAKKMKVTSRFLSQVERGISRFPIYAIKDFSSALEIDPRVVVHRMTENERENILREMEMPACKKSGPKFLDN